MKSYAESLRKKLRALFIAILIVLVAITMTIPAFADEAQDDQAEDEPDHYVAMPYLLNLFGNPDSQSMTLDQEEVGHLLDPETDYWTDLSQTTIPSIYLNTETGSTETSEITGIVPKYLKDDFEEQEKNANAESSMDINWFPTSGIVNGRHSMAYYVSGGGFSRGSDGFEKISDTLNTANQDGCNPLEITPNDILADGTDLDNLTVYGDLKKDGSSSSTAVDSYNPGDNICLDFSLSDDWVAKYLFTREMTRDLKEIGNNGSHKDNIMKTKVSGAPETLAFSLDIPKGVEVTNPKADVITPDVNSGKTPYEVFIPDKDNTPTTLVVKLKRTTQGDSLKDLMQNIKKDYMDGQTEIKISGLKVSDNADAGTYSMRGTGSGFVDIPMESIPGTFENAPEMSYRTTLIFAAKQGAEGRDAALPSDGSKNNMISYSFKVSKPSTPDTPYVPSTPTEPEQPKKHEVTIHEDNPTSDKPETTTKITVDDQGKVEKPAQDPVRPGYTFDGWYSDPECTIPFDFSKPVTGDLHIYAKWNKNVKPQTAKKVTGILLPKAIANGNSRQTVTWTPLINVDGYYVYEANCNTPKKTYHFKKVADVKASAPRVYKQSGLKKGVAYKYYVAAYQIKNGKKKVVKKSLSVHSIAGNIMRKHVNYTNVKSVSVRKNAVTLKVGKTYRIQPAVKGVFSNCAILQKGHAAMFRYVYIKDGKNISVSGNGVVKAKKAGKCNVYVLGTNGVRARVAVTVK